MTPAVDSAGTATTPQGFRAGATYAGIKTYGDGKLDLGILASDRPCAAAAVFTRNRLHSPCVDVNRELLADGRAQAVVVNSGNANSSTGERGVTDARQMSVWAAAKAGAASSDTLVSSTGVIGHFLPMEQIEAGIAEIVLDGDGGEAFARAIMTTDLVPKHGAVRFGPYTLGGCAKGSGMIHPNMATMLAYLTTDAPVETTYLQRALGETVDRTFNLISVDGDTSPSDTVLVLANGAAGGEPIAAGSEHAAAFEAALEALCAHLAKAIARDGEGATKLIEVRVSGARNDDEARRLVRAITTSYLVKSAVNGADPNWGRISAVIGRTDIAISEPEVTIAICGHRLFERTQPTNYDEAAVSRAMQDDTVTIEVGLGAGEASAMGWGCDLSAEYVRINADYTT